jgi:hypothetical protein
MSVDLKEALRYNPFDGDFGEVGDRELRDKIVTFRTGGCCHCCGQDIEPGTRGRSLTMLWVSDGVMSYRYCAPCTQAQADSWTDEGRSLEARFALRSAAA